MSEDNCVNCDSLVFAENSLAYDICEERFTRDELDELAELKKSGRLTEMLDAEREGRCVVLLCKVGDKIYTIEGKELTVERITITKHVNIYAHSAKYTAKGYRNPNWKGYEIKPKAFGKTIFLTREEAEEALENEG